MHVLTRDVSIRRLELASVLALASRGDSVRRPMKLKIQYTNLFVLTNREMIVLSVQGCGPGVTFRGRGFEKGAERNRQIKGTPQTDSELYPVVLDLCTVWPKV